MGGLSLKAFVTVRYNYKSNLKWTRELIHSHNVYMYIVNLL